MSNESIINKVLSYMTQAESVIAKKGPTTLSPRTPGYDTLLLSLASMIQREEHHQQLLDMRHEDEELDEQDRRREAGVVAEALLALPSTDLDSILSNLWPQGIEKLAEIDNHEGGHGDEDQSLQLLTDWILSIDDDQLQAIDLALEGEMSDY